MKLLVVFLLLCATVAHGQDEPEFEPQLPEDSLAEEDQLNSSDEMKSDDIDDAEMSEDNSLAQEKNAESRGHKCDRIGSLRPGVWYNYRGRNYIYLPYRRPWAYAQNHCLQLGGTLATVHNSVVNSFLKRLAQGDPAWIGFSDAQYDRFWFWINGERLVYANWCRGEPNNYHGRQDCAIINWTRAKCWDDQKCKQSFPYICEKK
ncbi:hypothetical protein NL108_005395 [Boleophthalmus pectinirostris]|uniref:ladderlectin-like n=1 Tax=Boleophthalmus pectinirostris TaxID=150288 RepID=UPI00242E9A70|nr:ladderlectin-like [Boleophthalmus pectinirostris]KAJ0055525.1 hypothetical protein NL108_005395 [Boleophthalmus pectinirostris]